MDLHFRTRKVYVTVNLHRFVYIKINVHLNVCDSSVCGCIPGLKSGISEQLPPSIIHNTVSKQRVFGSQLTC